MPRKKAKAPRAAKAVGEITIDNVPADLERRQTGLYSLDRAMGGGLPLRTAVEISGWEFSAKTTLALFLAGKVNPKGTIKIADFEPIQDPAYLNRALRPAEFSGTVSFCTKVKDKRPVPGETILEELAGAPYDPKVSALILDSVTSIYSESEEEGKIGEGRVARNAQLMKDYMKKVQQRLNAAEQPIISLITNHLHPLVKSQGVSTSGGIALHAIAATRFRLQPEREESHWVVRGKMIKRRFWGEEPPDTFSFVVVPGEGVHLGLSAVQDCLDYKIADKTKEGRIYLNGKAFGFLKPLVEKRDEVDFSPFVEALEAA